MADTQVFMVTGASKGMGLEIALRALQEGYTVIGTSRNVQKLQDEVAAALPDLADHFEAVQMAFTEDSIKETVAYVVDKYGHIDVLVNNAGYAVLGALEEFSLDEVKTNFDVNVFGVLSVMQAVLPHMRKQKSGRIINMASISGTVTGPTQSIYSASKAAVIMMSEALADEVAPFNIQVTAICPGGVRTDFLDASSMRKPAKHIADYEVVSQTMQGLARLNGNQSGDPKLVANVIVQVASLPHAPRRLYLNRGAVAGLQQKLQEVAAEANEFIDLSLSTDGQA